MKPSRTTFARNMGPERQGERVDETRWRGIRAREGGLDGVAAFGHITVICGGGSERVENNILLASGELTYAKIDDLQTAGLWVSPLRRGSSESSPAALTRRLDSTVLTAFGWM